MKATEPEVSMPILHVHGNVVRGQAVGRGELVEFLSIPSVSALVRSGEPVITVTHLEQAFRFVSRGVGPWQGWFRKEKGLENALYLALELATRLHPKLAVVVEIGANGIGRESRGMNRWHQNLSIPFHQGRTAPHAFVSRYQPQVALWPEGQAGHPIPDKAILGMEVAKHLPIPHHGPTSHRPQPQVAASILNRPEWIFSDLELDGGFNRYSLAWCRVCFGWFGSHLTSRNQQQKKHHEVGHAVKLGMN